MNKFLFVNSEGFYEEGYVAGSIDIRNCDSTLAVGDLVSESSTITNGVDKVIDNTSSKHVVGWVYNKPTSTTAEILFRGTITGLSGLAKAGKVYLSDTGTFTSVKPSANYLHILGQAVDVDILDFDPVNAKVKLA